MINGRRSSGLDLREILRVLRRRIAIVALTPLILVLMAATFIAFVTPLFTATSTVLIDPRRASVVDTGSQPVLSNFGTDDATIESQVLLIQSLAGMQRIVERLKLTDDPEFVPLPGIIDRVKSLFGTKASSPETSADAIAKARAIENLERKLKVIRQRATFLVDINASSREPAKAAKIANAVADAYFLEQVRSKYEATRIAADWLNKQIEELKSRVLASDKAVEDYRSSHNLIAAQGVTVNDQQLTDLNNRLVETRVQAAEARAKYDQVQQIAKSGSDPGAVAEALSSETVARLRTQYAELAKNEAELSTKYGARHPLVGTARAQLRDTSHLIDQEIQRVLQSRRHTYEVAAAREASLQKSLDDLQGVSTESGQAQIRLRELQREAEANRTLYEAFLARYKETSAQESLEMPESRVVTTAEVPVRPSFPKNWLILGLAFLLGLGLGGFLALLMDHLDRRIKTLEQAEEISGCPSIAAVPLVDLRDLARMARRGRRALSKYDPAGRSLLPPLLQPPLLRFAIEEPTSMFAEAVRATRLAIQHVHKPSGGQLVVVTSSIDGEGKTTLAANLALSLAVLGSRTILVDGDLRNPELTRSVCPRAKSGLLQVAMGEASLHQAILIEHDTGLSVLPSPVVNDAIVLTEFVFSDGMGAILNELRQHYDVIIVDSPPLMPLVDGRALAEHADGIILTVGWNRTPRDVVVRATELLAPVYDRIVGTVLTRVDLRRLRHYDYYLSSAYMRPYAYDVAARQEAAE